ncbi:transcription factor Sp4-like [Notothenia coriiceps]|uniref:Transcription factor Sp4-like n=1 Tax=Notothenia coriiceps TaxID=8208 RepID=A0A6I9NK06_9TELE|nr:PREDICTED: transcription factor Sp4-like [Notothenia coriiceps]
MSGGTAMGSGGLVSLSGAPLTLSAARSTQGSGGTDCSASAGLGTAGVSGAGFPHHLLGLQGQSQGQDGGQSSVVSSNGCCWKRGIRVINESRPAGSQSKALSDQGGPAQQRASPCCLLLSELQGWRGKRTPKEKKQHICHMEGCAKCTERRPHLEGPPALAHTEESRSSVTDLLCKRFTRSDELQNTGEHTTGEKRFECPECSKRFMRSDHLSKHIKTHQNKKGGAAVAIITTDDMEDDVPEDLDASPQIVATLSRDSDPATPTTSNHIEEEEVEEGEFE